MRERVFDVAVQEVHSGDDLVLLVDLDIDGLYKKVRARLKGVDTPSAFRLKGQTEAGAVRDRIKELTSRGQCRVIRHNAGKGGWLVTLQVVTGRTGDGEEVVTDINALLIAQGYVYKGRQEEEAPA